MTKTEFVRPEFVKPELVKLELVKPEFVKTELAVKPKRMRSSPRSVEIWQGVSLTFAGLFIATLTACVLIILSMEKESSELKLKCNIEGADKSTEPESFQPVRSRGKRKVPCTPDYIPREGCRRVVQTICENDYIRDTTPRVTTEATTEATSRIVTT